VERDLGDDQQATDFGGMLEAAGELPAAGRKSDVSHEAQATMNQ
jgi:hypothetical protein